MPDGTPPRDALDISIVRTPPELRANMRQNWELITFVSTGPPFQNYTCASTAAVFPPTPFETFLPQSAQRQSDSSMVENMETFTFDHGEETPERHYGKARLMEMGCIDHFSWIAQTVHQLPSYPDTLTQYVNQEPSQSYRVVSFIYKPIQNGWIVVETIFTNGQTHTYIHSRANKADSKREVNDQETLYFDSGKGQEVKNLEGGLNTHYRVMIDEIENNMGYHFGLESIDFDRIRLKEVVGV